MRPRESDTLTSVPDACPIFFLLYVMKLRYRELQELARDSSSEELEFKPSGLVLEAVVCSHYMVLPHLSKPTNLPTIHDYKIHKGEFLKLQIHISPGH